MEATKQTANFKGTMPGFFTFLPTDPQFYGGNCMQALRFYEQCLGGEITLLMRRAEQPNQPVTWPGREDSIQYASMNLDDTGDGVRCAARPLSADAQRESLAHGRRGR
jgi:uncharacterized glyoxalase superfamily protein PhnB